MMNGILPVQTGHKEKKHQFLFLQLTIVLDLEHDLKPSLKCLTTDAFFILVVLA